MPFVVRFDLPSHEALYARSSTYGTWADTEEKAYRFDTAEQAAITIDHWYWHSKKYAVVVELAEKVEA